MKRLTALFLLLALLLGMASASEPTPAPLPPEFSYFDDAVFIGDSVTNQLRRYRDTQSKEGVEIFGEAGFLAAGAYSLYLASLGKLQKDKVSPTYRGQRVTIPQGLVLMEAKKAYIMLGLADAPGKNPDQDMYRYAKLVRLIREAIPDIQIVAVSVTPMTQKAEDNQNTQDGVNLFNERLEALSKELGILYLDVATPLKNEDGFLNSAYSNDKKVHLNQEGLAIYVETLHQHARDQLSFQVAPGE